MDSSGFIQVAVLLLLAIASLATLWQRGLLGAKAFNAAPRREVDLTLLDVAVGLLLMYALAPLAAQAVAAAIDALGPDYEGLRYPLLLLFGQLAQAAPVVYLLVRLSLQPQPGGLRRGGLLPLRPLRDAGLGGLALVMVLPMVFAVNVVLLNLSGLWGDVPETGHEALRQMQHAHSPVVLVMLAISAVVIAPIIEELIYRGMFQTALLNLAGQKQRWGVVVIASAWFALIHLGAVPWQGLVGLFVLALALGWLYERTGRIWPGIVTHALFNAVNIALTLTVMR